MTHARTVRSPDRGALVVAVFAWFSVVVLASASGLLGALGRTFMPGYAILVALGIAAPTAAYFALPPVRATIDAVGLRALTLMHLWRIPAAAVFGYYGVRGELPAPFWILAGFGDLLAGAYAGTLLFGAPGPARYKSIHRFGFVDFVVAVGTGLSFTLVGDPRMAVLTTLPVALIPLFGVGLSGASHLIAFSMLRRGPRA